jgi:hypothetical protein
LDVNNTLSAGESREPVASGPEEINLDLKRHQLSIDDWDYRATMENLHEWAGRFILAFELQTTTPAITIEDLRKILLGHHRRGRNGFGLRHEIAISRRHLQVDEPWQVLGTELHELLHAEQEDVGKPGRRNYHNGPYRERARGLGLIVDEQGHQQYAQAPTPFLDLLTKYRVTVPKLPPLEIAVSLASRSRSRPWICGCRPRPIHIQVAISDWRAQCLKCGQMFTPKER